MPSTSASFTRFGARCAALLVITTCIGTAATVPPTDPKVSPDELWNVQCNVPRDQCDISFPPRAQLPHAFIALKLDAALLERLLAETSPDARIWLPLASGGFTQINLTRSQLMESGLAARFPQIKSYSFGNSDLGVGGHFVFGPGGVFLTAQTKEGLLRVEPVETASGRVYLSYFDRERTDGVNVLEHTEGRTDEPPSSTPALHALGLSAALAPANLNAGQNLRIYRLAASTTGEFYQARDNGGGLADVVASLVADLAGANAILEPEVSVRLILADASTSVIYSDPATDPFDNNKAPCDLRNDNRDNMKAVLADADYDLGFLFATRGGDGASGCAWYVVCLTSNDTLHKARGAGQMGNNGTNSASGLLAHEGGHMLGAHHTFSGQDAGCTAAEFNAAHAYEPGSGSTIMSYRGNCGADNVDTSVIGGGSYYHAHSFDEIVTNVFSGDGSTCGTLVGSGNVPPVVDAGPDYTIPRQTPFTLFGSGASSQPLTFVWEQFDAANTQRAINTDDGTGPIIRSVPPTADPTRTVPNLQDLLAGVTRNGEILPQVDRTLNFRMTARDNLMGGGGVNSDSMVLTVQGEPFYITSPNGGTLEAACQVPLTWQVGGGSVAAQVEALFSSDGGQHFDTPLGGPVANDGADSFIVPCALGNQGRIKLQSVGNIFFDINDQNLQVVNAPPSVQVSALGGAVDNSCHFTVNFEATANDSCGLNAANVHVDLIKGADNFTLGIPTLNIVQANANQVNVSGSVLVSDLLNSPAQLTVKVTATDACGALSSDMKQVSVNDDTPPQIQVSVDPALLWPPDHKMAAIHATVVASDNCPGVSHTLTSLTSDEPENGVADGDTAPDILGAAIGTADQDFELRSERAGNGDGRSYTVTYTAKDGSNNVAVDAATVNVPKSQGN